MVGQSHRVQIRHILLEKEEIANMIKEVVESISGHTGRVQTLMKLAQKYSLCKSKEDGGNLGWLEILSDDPRKIDYQPVFENVELEKLLRDGIAQRKLIKGKVFGPVNTLEGYHLVMISNEFGEKFHDTF